MRKGFQFENLLTAAFLMFFGTVMCFAQTVGGYQATGKDSPDVKKAAAFAITAENAKRAAGDAFKLRSIEKAEKQIVAGTNYRLCLEVESGGEKEQATVVVYRDLKNKYKLTSWEGGNCADAAATQPANEETDNFKGKLQVGKSTSTIVYVGAESGDYAAFCFANKSVVGRKILAKCKNGAQCEFAGKVNYESSCKVPGLKATLSAQGKIVSVNTVKSFAKKRATKRR